MNNTCLVTRLKNVRPHPNADRLQLATVCGTQVIVGLDANENDLVMYFDSNLRLSHEYLHSNNLYSNPELNSDTSVKGYFPSNGRVKCQKLRGELSNGFVADTSSLLKIGGIDPRLMSDGVEFNDLNGINICSKYVATSTKSGPSNRQKGPKPPASKMFKKHWDTPQLFRTQIDSTGQFYVEEKVHGTSGRTGRVLCDTNRPWWKFWAPKREWKVLSGTRKVDHIQGHISDVRAEVERSFRHLLKKGETVYYEIYGYDGGKEIQKGFHYDCRPGEFKAMVYRITMTNEDGYSVDMGRQYVYNRAHELGLGAPWLISYWPYMTGDTLESSVQSLLKGTTSYIDQDTVLEGVVIWYETPQGEWKCVKAKTEAFLLLDSRNKDNGVEDMEDSV